MELKCATYGRRTCVHCLFGYLHFRLFLFTHKRGDEHAAHKQIRRYDGWLLYEIRMPQIFRCDSLDSCAVQSACAFINVCECAFVFVHFILGMSIKHV